MNEWKIIQWRMKPLRLVKNRQIVVERYLKKADKQCVKLKRGKKPLHFKAMQISRHVGHRQVYLENHI